MVILKDIYLVTRNARDKVQQVNAQLGQDGNTFYILRITGQYLGKQTEQALITITEGKAKRTVLQQAELQFNSILNNYKKRGYKEITELTKTPFLELSEAEIDTLVPSVKSDERGFLKPMLAKDSNSVQSSVLNKPMLCSRKLDGVRAMIQYRDGKVHAISRGGTEYDVPTTHLRDDLADFFVENPSVILDGELYRHGTPLQVISGIARLKTWEPRCEKLQYWIYDIADSSKTFTERLEMLDKVKKYVEENNLEHIFVLEHFETESYFEIQELHNKWVGEGFEGLIARKPTSTYKFGRRGSDMLKVKEYMDSEFKIVDYNDGLRPEDFVFVLETEDGKYFSAKPIGTVEEKEQYMKDMDSIIGKMATVKYFDWSTDGIPLQPVLKAIRDYE